MILLRQTLALPPAALLACGAPEFTHEGVHVRVAAQARNELCAGTVAHMDRFIELMAAEFRIEPPTGRHRIEFVWLDPEELPGFSSCGEVLGCARGHRVVSAIAPYDHELVHALTNAFAHPAPFFSEGLAQAYEGIHSYEFDSEWEPGHVRDDLDADNFSAVDYDAAGAFVSHLVAAHGVDEFLRAYAAIPRSAELSEIDAVFRNVFGAALDDSVSDYETHARRCGRRGYTARLAECNAPELPWDDIRLVHWRDVACDQPDAIGPYEGAFVRVFHTVVVSEAGEFRLALAGVDDSATGQVLSLDACEPCAGPALTLGRGERATVPLSPGRYSLRLRGFASALTRVGVLIERVDSGAIP